MGHAAIVKMFPLQYLTKLKSEVLLRVIVCNKIFEFARRM